MSDYPALDRTAQAHPREITAETVVQICKLSDTLAPTHRKMVTPNGQSIAQAHFEPKAWFRAIHAAETPVGFHYKPSGLPP